MAAPVRFLSGRQQQQKIGIEGSTQNEKVLEVVGRAGIGTTIFEPNVELDVRGDVLVSGILTVGNITIGSGGGGTFEVENLDVSGVSTFAGAADFNSDVDIDGHTELDDVNISGVSTFAGAIDANGDLDVDGHTELDDVNISGVSTFAGAIDANGDLDVDGNANITGVVTATTFVGNLTGIATGATKVYVDESEDDDNDYNIVFTDVTPGSGNRHYTLQVDDNGLKFNPGTNLFSVSGILGSSYVRSPRYYDTDNLTTSMDFSAGGDIELKTGNVTRVKVGTDGNTTVFGGLDVSGVSTFAGAIDANGDLDVDGHTELDDVNVSGAITATTFTGDLDGNATTATTATSLASARNFEITGDVVASAISFDGTGNVSLAATIQPNSVELGTDTTGDYVESVSGTANEIQVTGGTGEGSTPTIGFVANPTIGGNVNIGQDLTVTRDLQVTRNLNVDGTVTIGGTSATIFAETLKISDPDIVLGFRTDANGNDVSTDSTASHGGVALASTEGSPLVSLVGAGETLPATYKKIMWFKTSSFAGLSTDAWLSNYAFGVGTTSMSAGTKFAVGNIEADFDDFTSVRNINSSGVGTFTTLDIGTGGIDVDGHTELDNVNISGVTTASNTTIGFGNTEFIVDGDARITGVITANRIYSEVFGEFTGSSVVSDSLVGTGLSISGISTLGTVQISSGIVTATSGVVTYYGDGSNLVDLTGASAGTYGDADSTAVIQVDSDGRITGITTVVISGSGAIASLLEDTTPQLGGDLDLNGNDITGTGNINITGVITATSFDGSIAFSNVTGVTTDIVGDTTPQLGGDLDLNGNDITGTGNANITGVITATSFDGSIAFSNVTGVTTEISGDTTPQLGGDLDLNGNDITGTGNINITGVVTATSANFSGNVSIGGTLTYEDVTNIDSIGLITARSGIIVNAGGVNVTGVSTFQSHVHLGDDDELRFGAGDDFKIYHDPDDARIENSNGDIKFKNTGSYFFFNSDGSETLASFINDGAANLYYKNSKKFETTGYGVDISGGINATGVITATTVVVGSAVTIGVAGINANTGVITASSFEGDGSNLSGISAGIVPTENTTNQAQFIPFFTGTATTSVAGISSANFVFNPSTNRMGIGLTDPESTLEINVGTAVSAFDIQGSEGQLFSVTNNLTSGSIFSVNDVSGIPSIDVDADGTIQLAPYGTGEKVGIGTTEPKEKLHVVGVVSATSFFGDGSSLTGVLADIVDDTTPQLGGNLDLNGNYITGSGGINVTGVITATTVVVGSAVTIGVAGINANTGVITASSLDSAICRWVLESGDGSNYGISGPGLTGTENDPTFYVHRGQKYIFKNETGGHPFRIQSTVNGSAGTQYNDGISNNDAGDGTSLVWDVQFDAPDVVYYQCTTGGHGAMGGKIYVMESVNGTDININTTGVITATSFDGSIAFSNVTGVTTEIAGDTTPQLGGDLDLNSNDITGTGNVGVGTTNPTSAVVAGNTSVVHAGIVTANYYYGDGSNLTSLPASASSGEFYTGITSSVQITPLSYETSVFTFPSTAGKQYVIESINVANVDTSVGVGTTVNIIASIQDATAGEQTYIAYNVPIVNGGVIELLKNPIVAGPSDVIKMWTTNENYTGVNNAAEVYMNYDEYTSTDYVKTFASTVSIATTDVTNILTSTSNPTVIESIHLANRTDTGDYPVSVRITQGTSTSHLVKDLLIPRYSTVDILDRPKRIETNGILQIKVEQTSTIDVIVASKKITS